MTKSLHKKYAYITSGDLVIIYHITYIDQSRKTYKTNNKAFYTFEKGSKIDLFSFEVDADATEQSVKEQYPELFL